MGSERRRADRYPLGVRVEFSGGSGLTRDVSGLGVFFETDVRVSFRDDGRQITGLVTLTSTVTELELNRLVRVASLTISGYGGGAEPEIRKEIADAVANRRPGQRLVAIKMYGTLGAVISAPEDGAVVIVIERRKC